MSTEQKQASIKRILILCPSCSERQHLPQSQFIQGRYELIYHGTNIQEEINSFDALAFIDTTVERFRSASLDGVASASDYPGCLVAAAVAQRLNLPGPDLATLLTCSHKYYSRLAQFASVPEATVGFALIDPYNPQLPSGLSFPLFVKPVKSCFSVFARRVNNSDELIEFVSRSEVQDFFDKFTRPFNQLLKLYNQFDLDARYMLAEELISGDQVTVEGFVHDGNIEILGITDSIMHPETISFARFEYPSSLPQKIQNRMIDIVCRVIQGIGLDNTLFNVELFYDESHNVVKIIEINPRMAGQFADLVEKVNGVNTFDIMLSLASGQMPHIKVNPPMYKFSASFPLRVFQDKILTHVPNSGELIVADRVFPGIQLTLYYHEGQKLSDTGPDQNDMESYCYGCLNLGGISREELLENFARAYQLLGFQLDDVD